MQLVGVSAQGNIHLLDPEADTHPEEFNHPPVPLPRDDHWSGWYASNWNAFFSNLCLIEFLIRNLLHIKFAEINIALLQIIL